jgi:tol-pal system protein YbgF
MKKLVVAGMLCLAAVTGTERGAEAGSLFGLHFGRDANQNASPSAPVVNVQSGGAEVRIQQMEDQMRQLNGRIEEMSFQILQMQEQLRKTQEDNEFRFQQLEKTGGTPAKAPTTKKSEADVAPPASGQGDDVAGVIRAPQETETAPSADVPENDGLGQPPQQLGSVEFDQSGNQIGASVNQNAGKGSTPLPGVDASAPQQTASLGSEADQYKAAYGHVLSGDYGTAEQEFTQYITRYPSSARSADANFWLGEALYSQGKYNDAAKAPEMLLKLGMSLAALDNTDTACATLKEVTKRYPKASRAVITKVASEQKRLAC